MTRKERALKNLKQMCSDGRYLGSGSYAPLEVLEDFEFAIKALEQEPCDDIVNRKLEELFERVENIEKQIKEDKEEQLKNLKAELDYAKFRCTS